MFERFLATYGAPTETLQPFTVPTNTHMLAGATFGCGLYRIHTQQSAALAANSIGVGFPEFRGHATPFGFDWLGRQFCHDLREPERSDSPVLMFEPGTGEVLALVTPFEQFHDHLLVDHADAALVVSFFHEWHTSSQVVLQFQQCAGYRMPLFLSGPDDITNLEVTDLDVYWTITSHILQQVRPTLT